MLADASKSRWPGRFSSAVTVCIHGVGLLALSRLLRRVIDRYRPHKQFSSTVVVMVATVLGLFALHTVEIWVWAFAFVLVGALPDFCVCTELLDVVLLDPRRSGRNCSSGLAAFRRASKASNGFLLIGWSTAYLIPAWTRYGPFHEERGF